ELDRRIISVVQFEVPGDEVGMDEPQAQTAQREAPTMQVETPPSQAETTEVQAEASVPEAAPVSSTSKRRPTPSPVETPIDLRTTDPGLTTAASNGLPPKAPVRRIVVETVTAVRNGPRLSAQVELRRGDEQALGIAEGLMTSGSDHRLVAAATLNALREFEPAAERAEVEMATVLQLGDRQVAVASIIYFVPPYEEIVAGSAMVRSAGEHDALVRAVLDATNRRLGRAGRDR
ncbi:MAG TPA: hypothetical protein VNY84_03785, partial [Acidimicrobiales bacterium]|nr:hypothetical protein [Acidimicrobiales bacterium]